MKKSVRITIYFLSVLTLAALVLVAVFAKADRTDSKKETERTESSAASNREEEHDSQAPQTEPEQKPETESETEAESETEKQPEQTTLAFGGDVLFADWAFYGNYDAQGIKGLLSDELLSAMQGADILMVNNEFAFSTRGTPAEDKQFTFRCDPKYVTALNEMGVDLVSLANNHSLDYGREALSDTFSTLDDAGILYAGAGDSIERAKELQIIEKNGLKFGFLAASRVIPVVEWDVRNAVPGLFTAYDDTMLVEEIAAARETCDFLTVYLHWGVERDAYPQDYQTQIAADCFAAGADLVIGAHPHCLQGIEFMEGKPVFYSLGNYIFGSNIEKTALLLVTVGAKGAVEYRMIPARSTGGRTKEQTGAEAAAVYAYMQEISVNAQIDSEGRITEKIGGTEE